MIGAPAPAVNQTGETFACLVMARIRMEAWHGPARCYLRHHFALTSDRRVCDQRRHVSRSPESGPLPERGSMSAMGQSTKSLRDSPLRGSKSGEADSR